MDYHGFLTTFRKVAAVCLAHRQQRTLPSNVKWAWIGTPVFYPESICPFCTDVIRSEGVWLFDGVNQTILLGGVFPRYGAKLVKCGHPHAGCGGTICRGGHTTGISVLASMPTTNDMYMGRIDMCRWLKRYWNHKCDEMCDYLVSEGYSHIIGELDRV